MMQLNEKFNHTTVHFFNVSEDFMRDEWTRSSDLLINAEIGLISLTDSERKYHEDTMEFYAKKLFGDDYAG